MEIQKVFRVRKVRGKNLWRINEYRKGEVVFGDIFYEKEVAEQLAREANAFETIQAFILKGEEECPFAIKWTGQFTTW